MRQSGSALTTAATCSRRIVASSSPFPGFAESFATTVSTFAITPLPPRGHSRLVSPSRAHTGASGARARRRPVLRCRIRPSPAARSAGGGGCARRRAPAPGRSARGEPGALACRAKLGVVVGPERLHVLRDDEASVGRLVLQLVHRHVLVPILALERLVAPRAHETLEL